MANAQRKLTATTYFYEHLAGVAPDLAKRPSIYKGFVSGIVSFPLPSPSLINSSSISGVFFSRSSQHFMLGLADASQLVAIDNHFYPLSFTFVVLHPPAPIYSTSASTISSAHSMSFYRVNAQPSELQRTGCSLTD